MYVLVPSLALLTHIQGHLVGVVSVFQIARFPVVFVATHVHVGVVFVSSHRLVLVVVQLSLLYYYCLGEGVRIIV